MRTASDLTADELTFLTERHLATLTTLRNDNTPHVVAIAFGYDPETQLVRIISSDGTRKVRNVEALGYAAVCQVDGARWLTLEGTARVVRDPDAVQLAIKAFEARYRPARENPNRVAIEIRVGRILGRA
ncbi:F420-dependent biliverdin reductase [soil metagenome]